jgi:hypothetical protein
MGECDRSKRERLSSSIGGIRESDGGLRSHLEQQLIRWLMQHARFAFSNRQSLLLGSYGDDMDLLTLQTLHALWTPLRHGNWQQSSLQWQGQREKHTDAAQVKLSGSRLRRKFQVSSDAVLTAQSLSRPPDLKSIHGSIQNALSLVIDRISPNAAAQLKRFR